jgi:hypothetical protein
VKTGLGEAVLDQLTAQERKELDSYGKEIAELAANQLVGVLAYSSNPESLLSSYFGFAELRSDGLLKWAFREPLELAPARRSSMRIATTVDSRPTFDAGTPKAPTLRPRSPLEGTPTSEPIMVPDSTATDE